MTTEAKDGGAAFPRRAIGSELAGDMPGLSIRDWFAGQFLAGMIAAPPGRFKVTKGFSDKEATAQACYDYADALLAERARR